MNVTLLLAGSLTLVGLVFLIAWLAGTRAAQASSTAGPTWRPRSGATLQQPGERIFAVEDWEFILREAPQLRRAFLRDRRAIARAWLGQGRECVREIMKAHRQVARAEVNVSASLEAKLALGYFVFMAASLLAEGLVWLPGFWGQKLVYKTMEAGNLLRSFGGAEPQSAEAAPAD
jgi:hypothetical protein